MNQNINTILYSGNNLISKIPDTQCRMYKCPNCNNVITITNAISGAVPISPDDFAISGCSSNQLNIYKCPKCYNEIKINNSVSSNVPMSSIYNNDIYSNKQSSIYKCPHCTGGIVFSSDVVANKYVLPFKPNFLPTVPTIPSIRPNFLPIEPGIIKNDAWNYNKPYGFTKPMGSSDIPNGGLKGSMDRWNV